MIELSMTDIHLGYGDHPVLKGISLDLHEGEVMVLLGSSGSGKTTLLRSIAGLETPSKGVLSIHNSTVFDTANNINLSPNQRNLGMVFQSYALWPHRSVFDNVAYGLRIRKIASAEVRRKVNEVLEALGLGQLADRLPHQLSGGQQQRVAIARALVYSPPVLLMDEPLSNLDAQLREDAKSWLKQVIKRLKLSAIIVTHDQAEAMAIGDKVVLLVNGSVEQVATPYDIYNNPASLHVACFFGANNQFRGKIIERTGNFATISAGPLRLEGTVREDSLRPGDACSAVIRVDDCTTARPSGIDTAHFELVTSMYAGGFWEHLFSVSDGQLIRARTRDPLGQSRSTLAFARDALWIFKEREGVSSVS